MNLFYTRNVIDGQNPAEFLLDRQEAHHALKVLRVRNGDRISATDGKGSIYTGRVVHCLKNSLRAEIQHQVSHPKPFPDVVIAAGQIKKRDRLEFAVEKAVEMGVLEIVVFNAVRSEKKNVRLDRLQAAAFSAMKQSLRPWLPVVGECADFKSVLQQYATLRTIVVDEHSREPDAVRNDWKNEEKLLFIVGPEGGFSGVERGLIKSQQLETLSLGSYRLRAETAVIAVASMFAARV